MMTIDDGTRPFSTMAGDDRCDGESFSRTNTIAP
jgi:hypothetical protein